MLHTLLDATFIIVLFVCVRSSDITIGAIIGRSYIRAVCYGIVALLALLYVALALIGH